MNNDDSLSFSFLFKFLYCSSFNHDSDSSRFFEADAEFVLPQYSSLSLTDPCNIIARPCALQAASRNLLPLVVRLSESQLWDGTGVSSLGAIDPSPSVAC